MDCVLGHDDAKQRFGRTLARRRLASTYLFVGPAGIGKRLFAERLAAALVCRAPAADGLTACGRCDSCAMSAAATHPDVLRVARPDGKTTLPIDVFLGPADKRNREGLCHDLALKPLVADRRVAIIDDADDLGVEAANCLLKTLEEPPPRSLLILIGTSLARQLPTIRSRSQVVRFRPLEDSQVAAVLAGPPHALPQEEATRLAASGGGSVGRGLALAGGGLDRAREEVARHVGAPRTSAHELARVFEEETKGFATEPRLRRLASRELLGAAIGTLHERLLERAGDPSECDAILARLDACLDAEDALERNGNQSAVAAHWADSLARAAD